MRRGIKRLPCAPVSAGDGRRFCALTLESELGAAASMVGDDAEMITSELVTNAVNANSASIELWVEVLDDRVRIAVTDDGVGMPQRQQPGNESGHGRGLMIVSALAQHWGVESLPTGKRVWAELPLAVASV